MPTIIRVPAQYAVNTIRRNVEDALVIAGEECIVLSMYHIAEDINTQPRCPICYDDIYQSGKSFECSECYGTTFLDGVKKATRAWAIFTDSTNQENFTKRGEVSWNTRQVQIEAAPFLRENDYVIRVKEWQSTQISGYRIPIPKVYGERCRLDVITEITVRTGSRYAQNQYDKIGQRSSISDLPHGHPIYNYVPPEPVLRVDEQLIP